MWQQKRLLGSEETLASCAAGKKRDTATMNEPDQPETQATKEVEGELRLIKLPWWQIHTTFGGDEQGYYNNRERAVTVYGTLHIRSGRFAIASTDQCTLCYRQEGRG
jgi:hypothetical protein